MVRDGKLIRGQLVHIDVKDYEDDDGDERRRKKLVVRFRTSSGQTLEGEKEYSMPRHSEDGLPTEEHDTVAIFYVNDKQWDVL
ncbi:MAG: hypothetical protein NZ750_08325 [Anaerolineae bacterium]|nr:hypothetical protein [Anaerolineae bacterium]